MLVVKNLDFDLVDIFYNFFIYSFIGWIYESGYVSVTKKILVNRGFLNGPIIPLYGCGATLVFIIFWRYKGQDLIIFFGGMFVATMLEYITSYLMEAIFHAKWWDYCDMKFNVNGRICLAASLVWGFLSLLMINVIQPIVIYIINLLKSHHNKYVAFIIITVFCLDVTITVVHTLKLDELLSELHNMRIEFSNYMVRTNLFESKDDLKNQLFSNKFTELLDNIKKALEENKEKLIENQEKRKSFGWRKFKKDVEKHVKEYTLKFQTQANNTSFVQKRLLKAFPKLDYSKREDVLKELRERLLKIRNNKKG